MRVARTVGRGGRGVRVVVKGARCWRRGRVGGVGRARGAVSFGVSVVRSVGVGVGRRIGGCRTGDGWEARAGEIAVAVAVGMAGVVPQMKCGMMAMKAAAAARVERAQSAQCAHSGQGVEEQDARVGDHDGHTGMLTGCADLAFYICWSVEMMR